MLYHCCFLGLEKASESQKLKNNNRVKSLNEIIEYSLKYQQGPVVIFPEGVTSNGRGTLQFQNNYELLLKTMDPFILLFK
jgi:hypothetical protein